MHLIAPELESELEIIQCMVGERPSYLKQPSTPGIVSRLGFRAGLPEVMGNQGIVILLDDDAFVLQGPRVSLAGIVNKVSVLSSRQPSKHLHAVEIFV
jgi:hypothetical protein